MENIPHTWMPQESDNIKKTKRLTFELSLASVGFYLIDVADSTQAGKILEEIIKSYSSTAIIRYEIKNDVPSDLDAFKKWIHDMKIPSTNDANYEKLFFVIDGSGIEAGNENKIIDHFAPMNALRDWIVGNNRGITLMFIPDSLDLHRIGGYGDLMSCCSRRISYTGGEVTSILKGN